MRNRISKKLLVLIMAAVIIITLCANRIICVKDSFVGVLSGQAQQGEGAKAEEKEFAADSEEGGQAQGITVSGLKTEYTKTPKATIRNTIRITQKKEYEIFLQMYQPLNQTWKTEATFAAEADAKGKVTLVYPSVWQKTNTSLWRIVIDEKDGDASYTSENIQITTRNREKVKLKAKSAIIMEAESGQVYYGKSMNTQRANASTTKIMTALLALEEKKLNSTVKLTKEAVNTPYSHLGYGAVNDRVRMKDMLYMAMLPSDNGAATALAIHTGGSKKAFIKMMNQKAKELGCVDTSFKTPHGLDAKNHYSTAEDLALIARAAMDNETFREIVSTKSYKFRTKKKRHKYIVNSTNKLLGNVKGVCGVKTGYTDDAGYCFVGAYQYKGKTYITVVLGSSGSEQRWDDTKQLIRYIKEYM